MKAVRDFVSDASSLAWRSLWHNRREPGLIVFATVQPVVFIFLFVAIFGGAIKVSSGYTDFVIPGIFVQTMAFAAAITGVGLAQDVSDGFVDRLRVLPISRFAILVGRVLGDFGRMVFLVVAMTFVSFAVGFRVANVGGYLLGALCILSFGLSLSLVAAWLGLRLKGPETVNAATSALTLPFTFASSAFVPIATMPSWLRGTVTANPVSIVVDVSRSLFRTGTADVVRVEEAVAWILGLAVIASVLTVRQFAASK